MLSLKYCWKGIKHHNPNPQTIQSLFFDASNSSNPIRFVQVCGDLRLIDNDLSYIPTWSIYICILHQRFYVHQLFLVSDKKTNIYVFCETAPKNHNTEQVKEHQFIFISTDKQVLTFRETSKSIKRDLLINFHQSIPLREFFLLITPTWHYTNLSISNKSTIQYLYNYVK